MYHIRRGWPADGAIDEVAEAATGQTVTEGMIVAFENGKLSPATFSGAAAPTDPVAGFVIGVEPLSGKLIALLSACVIEMDEMHYTAASYQANALLTAAGGKFTNVSSAGEKPVAKVLRFDPTSKILRALWFAGN